MDMPSWMWEVNPVLEYERLITLENFGKTEKVFPLDEKDVTAVNVVLKLFFKNLKGLHYLVRKHF